MPDDFWAAPPKLELEADLVSRCREDAEAMGVYLEVAGQRKAKGSGTTVGFPDAILYAAGHVVPVEFKRAADGRISAGQAAAMLKRERLGVAWQGRAWHGAARPGVAWQGMATSSKEVH